MSKDVQIGPVWVTKYVLSKGIIRYDSVDQCKESPSMICAFMHGYFHGEGREWHRTEAAAIARAEQMRLKRIESLAQQIAKLKKLRFEVA